MRIISLGNEMNICCERPETRTFALLFTRWIIRGVGAREVKGTGREQGARFDPLSGLIERELSIDGNCLSPGDFFFPPCTILLRTMLDNCSMPFCYSSYFFCGCFELFGLWLLTRKVRISRKSRNFCDCVSHNLEARSLKTRSFIEPREKTLEFLRSRKSMVYLCRKNLDAMRIGRETFLHDWIVVDQSLEDWKSPLQSLSCNFFLSSLGRSRSRNSRNSRKIFS